jgi:hypothetical protein
VGAAVVAAGSVVVGALVALVVLVAGAALPGEAVGDDPHAPATASTMATARTAATRPPDARTAGLSRR